MSQQHDDMQAILVELEKFNNEIVAIISRVDGHEQQLELLAAWREKVDQFQLESVRDRKELREMFEEFINNLPATLSDLLNSEEYQNRRKVETKSAMKEALAEVFNLKRISMAISLLWVIMLIGEKTIGWLS